jgi:hypothetical protein
VLHRPIERTRTTQELARWHLPGAGFPLLIRGSRFDYFRVPTDRECQVRPRVEQEQKAIAELPGAFSNGKYPLVRQGLSLHTSLTFWGLTTVSSLVARGVQLRPFLTPVSLGAFLRRPRFEPEIEMKPQAVGVRREEQRKWDGEEGPEGKATIVGDAF